MTKEDIEKIENVAKNELNKENFRESVEKRKAEMREKRLKNRGKSLWDKIFPWKIVRK